MAAQTLYIHCRADNPNKLIFGNDDLSQDPDFGQGYVLLETRQIEATLPDNLNQLIQKTLERQVADAKGHVNELTRRRIESAEMQLDTFLRRTAREASHDPQMA